MLGGFGHEIGGELFNVDTLKFFEVLIAMERGAVLAEFAGDARRSSGRSAPAGEASRARSRRCLPNTTYMT